MEPGIKIQVSCCWPDGLPKTTTYFNSYPDVELRDVLNGFYACMIGQTWDPTIILEEMKEFVEERLADDKLKTNKDYYESQRIIE